MFGLLCVRIFIKSYGSLVAILCEFECLEVASFATPFPVKLPISQHQQEPGGRVGRDKNERTT